MKERSRYFPSVLLLVVAAAGFTPSPTVADHFVFVADASRVRVSDINTLAPITDLTGSLATCGGFSDNCAGFDDGLHMVVDSLGRRIFVSDHDSDFSVYDFSACLTEVFPTFGGSLSEPLGIATLPDGKLLITDEEDSGGPGSEGLFRLNSDLTLDLAASGKYSLDGAEGVAYDAVHDRIYVADEDDYDIEIFDGSTLAHIASVPFCSFGDGAYWLGVDGSSNRLFVLSDSRCSQTGPASPTRGETSAYGIHVYQILSGGDDLEYNETLFGSGGPLQDCFGTLAVSESTDRLFAIDYCNHTVAIFDTTTLEFLGTMPVDRAGEEPLMVSVGDIEAQDCNSNGIQDSCDLCPPETDGAGWTEVSDAGELLASAQTPRGTGPLASISGTIDFGCDADVYKIRVTGGGTFSASTVGNAPFDTELFLFDANGFGVYTNDDVTADSVDVTSRLPDGDPLTPVTPGIYFLAISGWKVDPVSTGGFIFPNPNNVPDVFGPTGPGGGSPLSGWDPDGISCFETGAYTTLLTGAEFVGCSLDCNGNGVPDECETDCNANGVADECELNGQTDANADGLLDECDPCLGGTDATPPVITNCPATIRVSLDANCGFPAPDFSFEVGVADDCTDLAELVVTTDPPDLTTLAVGTHQVTVTIADEAGNATACDVTFIIEVGDCDTGAPEPPEPQPAPCPPDAGALNLLFSLLFHAPVCALGCPLMILITFGGMVVWKFGHRRRYK
ncbi:MAG: DVUA0089 family protein [Phycisphaerae bacterium]